LKRPKVLYHFTDRAWWHFIQAEGITRGECPVNARLLLNWPNFTADPEPGHQDWVGRSPRDKRAVRIAVPVRVKDSRWIPWVDLTRQHEMDRATFLGYHRTGGGHSGDWWNYRGAVRPSDFLAVDFLDGGHIDPTSAEVLELIQECGARTYAELIELTEDRLFGDPWKVAYAKTPLGRAYPVRADEIRPGQAARRKPRALAQSDSDPFPE
jgi:hypothetical protein